MFLEYGVNDTGELVYIDQVGRGKLDGIFCPYWRRETDDQKGSD